MPKRIAKDKNFIPDEDSLVFTQTELDIYRARKEREKNVRVFNWTISNFSNKHGGFTFLTTKKNTLQKMNPATVGRLAYLSTYLDYENQQLIYEDRAMLKRDLPTVLNLSRPTANHFYRECVDAGVLEDRGDEGLFLNGSLFFKGTTKSKERTRLFRITVQQLYKKLPHQRHDLFGYVIQLIPFINFEWNIVCENPHETNEKLIQPLSFKQVCNQLGYDYDHLERLKKALMNPIFAWNHHKQALCGVLSVNSELGRENMLVVNPHILYAGNHVENVKLLEIAFTPKKVRSQKKG